ncbi:MAG: ABC-type iron transport system FetAB permease component [Halobacteriales archaeon]|jgi:ABC-type iron transport system FetAB permease component
MLGNYSGRSGRFGQRMPAALETRDLTTAVDSLKSFGWVRIPKLMSGMILSGATSADGGFQ